MLDMIKTTDDEFRRISRLVYDKFGINLTDKKRTLVNSRLQAILRKYRFTSFSTYINYLENSRDSAPLTELVNRISTNHTYFFREIQHFEFLRTTLLPEVSAFHRQRNSRRIKVWCAAASSGEEPYSLAIEMMEYFGYEYDKWDAGLLATDISEEALGKARRGQYSPDRLKPIDEKLRRKYFTRKDNIYEVKDFLKKEVLFRKFNLIDKTFRLKGNFDLISCRNVMIYFDRKTKTELVNKLYDQLRPGGYLFTGHSESLNSLPHRFRLVRSAVYQK
ncbi:MAG: CheR family methyltransferase [Fibrobacterota bacterium]